MIMSLSNRFSTLLLGTLGLVLVGFSTALFVTSRIYLNRQVDDRLTAILNLLNTCVDHEAGLGKMGAEEKGDCPRVAGMNGMRQPGWSLMARTSADMSRRTCLMRNCRAHGCLEWAPARFPIG